MTVVLDRMSSSVSYWDILCSIIMGNGATTSGRVMLLHGYNK